MHANNLQQKMACNSGVIRSRHRSKLAMAVRMLWLEAHCRGPQRARVQGNISAVREIKLATLEGIWRFVHAVVEDRSFNVEGEIGASKCLRICKSTGYTPTPRTELLSIISSGYRIILRVQTGLHEACEAWYQEEKKPWLESSQ